MLLGTPLSYAAMGQIIAGRFQTKGDADAVLIEKCVIAIMRAQGAAPRLVESASP